MGKKFSELIQEYEEHLFDPTWHMAARVARGHCSIVVAFERFLTKRGLGLTDATPKLVHDYLLNRSSMGISYYTLGFHCRVLGGFYSFLIERGLVQKNPVSHDSMPNFDRHTDGKKVISIKSPRRSSGFYKNPDGSFGLRFDLGDLIEEAEEDSAAEQKAMRPRLIPPPDEVA